MKLFEEREKLELKIKEYDKFLKLSFELKHEKGIKYKEQSEILGLGETNYNKYINGKLIPSYSKLVELNKKLEKLKT